MTHSSLSKFALIALVALTVVLAGCTSGGGGTAGDSGGDGQMMSAPLIISHEIVPGHAGFPEETSALVQPCVPLGTYAPGMQPAWHVSVTDPTTGEFLTNQTVDNVYVTLDDGTRVATEFHDDDSSWHGCIVLPEDQPEGEVGFTITVEVGDETYEQAGSFDVVPRDQI